MGMIEDIQADNEKKYGKKNASDTYDSTKQRLPTASPTPPTQSNGDTGNIVPDFTKAMEKRVQTFRSR